MHGASSSIPWAVQSQETIPIQGRARTLSSAHHSLAPPGVSDKRDHPDIALTGSQPASVHLTLHTALILHNAAFRPTLPLLHVHCKPRLNPQVHGLHADSAHSRLKSPVQLPLSTAGSLLPLHTPHHHPLCSLQVSSQPPLLSP